jgi:beta-mannanase
MRPCTSNPTRKTPRRVAALAATALAATLAVAPGSTSGAAASGHLLVGVHFDDSSNTGAGMGAFKAGVTTSQLDAGRRVDLIQTTPYGFTATFPTWRETWIANNGSEPVIQWNDSYTPGINKGKKDAAIATVANNLKAYGKPVMLEFAPGMDDPAQAATQVDANTFKAAWTRVHGIFAAQGASNVSWVFCPTNAGWNNGTAANWYPGAANVDWTCAQGAPQSSATPFASTYAAFDQAAPALGKPMMIAGFGNNDSDQSAKAQWITDAYNALAGSMSNVSAVVEDGIGADAMTSSPQTESAWAAAVSQPALYTAPSVTLPTGPLVPASGTMLGAMVTKGNKTSEPAAWNTLESISNNNVKMAQIIYPWGATITDWRDNLAIQNGRTPMISWGGTTTTDITSGKYDSYITAQAQAIKALNTPVFLRWFWEMDGNTFAAQAVSPDAFKAAWVHIHQIFDSVGANKVAWVFCPTGYGFDKGVAQGFYPGDQWVDWVAADGFNGYPVASGTSPTDFAATFSTFYAWGMAQNKPMMVAATGSVENGTTTDKAKWIQNMARAVNTYMPGIRAICYLDEPSGWYTDPSLTMHWELATSNSATAAWTQITGAGSSFAAAAHH